MSPIATQSALTANLAALGERHADLAERIRGVAPAAGLAFSPTGQDAPTATLDDVPLASRHRPRDEAERLAAGVDVVENAVVVVLGFGLGYHVEAIARRMGRTGVIVVFEPDLALLRAVLERIDHSRWIEDALLVFVTDPADRGGLGRRLVGSESILAQGIEFVEHPASRGRLAESGRLFRATFTEFVETAKTTLMTTLVRSIDTTRNLMLNFAHYAGGPPAEIFRDAARGRLGIVVAAGPSLAKNIDRLRQPGVRERAVVVAVQTTLKPLLDVGVRPHFVTALDYHEISTRFYEGLGPDDVDGVTLIADPKAHPAILEAFPGRVCCCASGFLDQVLGDLRRDMGDLPAGATVAHLALYVARFLGCDPIALVGQDLGFPDGLYYAPGTAIHDVWAPELNPFNTIAMMEWKRIARHRPHLHKTTDVFGKSIYTDAQMLAYLQQFERDFGECAKRGIEIIDATEGGVRKQHVRTMPLEEVLDRHLDRPPLELPVPANALDRARLAAADDRLGAVRRDVDTLRDVSDRTMRLIERMIEDQADPERMASHFRKLDRYRKMVDERFESFKLVNHLNQLGVFKRLKADRRLHLRTELGAVERQRAQLDRDLENVVWIRDAAKELAGQVDDARRVLRGEPVSPRPRPIETQAGDVTVAAAVRVAAVVPVDPERSGLGIERSLAADFGGRTVLQATLERLAAATTLDAIILVAPHGAELEPLLDRDAIDARLEIERCDGSPFGPERRAITAARAWARTCWRGGIAGMSVYDEILCPEVTAPLLEKHGLTAALVAAPDWPLVDPSPDSGIDAVVARFAEHPAQHEIVFTQAPPGLGAIVLAAPLVDRLRQRSRLSTVGALLTYQPHLPQGDPIARDGNVRIDPRVRRSLVRATFDSPRQQRLLARALARGADLSSPVAVVEAVERAWDEACCAQPERIVIELTAPARPRMAPALVDRIVDGITSFEECVVTLGGAGDPLDHESFDEIVTALREAGALAVEVRTSLRADHPVLDRLLACRPDVVTVDLHADRAATYEAMTGHDAFAEVLSSIQHVVEGREHLSGPPGTAALALPWIVPRLDRCATTYEDIDSFFDRWQHILGAALLTSPSRRAVDGASDDTLTAAETPTRVLRHDALRHLTILSDGTVPDGAHAVGAQPLPELWSALAAARTADGSNRAARP